MFESILQLVTQYLSIQNPFLNVFLLSLFGIMGSKLFSFVSLFFDKIIELLKQYFFTFYPTYQKKFKIEYNLEHGMWHINDRFKGNESIVSAIIKLLRIHYHEKISCEEYIPTKDFENNITGVNLKKENIYYLSKLGYFMPIGVIKTAKLKLEFTQTLDEKKTYKSTELTITCRNQKTLDLFIKTVLKTIQDDSMFNYSRKIFQLSPLTLQHKEPCYFSTDFESTRTMESIFFNKKQELCQYLDWFIEKSGPFSRGNVIRKMCILLHGPPGTGKSSIIRAINNYLFAKGEKRHIRYIHLTNISDDILLTEVLHTDRNNVISVIEDITDQGINEILKPKLLQSPLLNRELDLETKRDLILSTSNANATSTSTFTSTSTSQDNFKINFNKITLSGFLNALDGSIELTNSIVIITTNKKEKLHDALIRPGRITLDILLDKMDKECLCDMIHYYYNKENKQNILKKLKEYKDGSITPAEVERIILCHWGKNIDFIIQQIVNILK